MEAPHHPLRALALVAVVAAAVMIPAAAATPGHGQPAAYYGSVTDADGDPAPAGTEIVAVVNGSVVDRITVQEAGEYGGEDATDDKLDTSTHAGDTVTFHLGSADGPVAAPPGDHEITNGTHELALVFPASAFAGSGGGTTTTSSGGGAGGGGGGGGGGAGGGGGGGGGATTTSTTAVSTTATTPVENATVTTTSTSETSASDDTSGTTRASGTTSTTSTTAANATSTKSVDSPTTIPDGISRVPTPGFGPAVTIVGALAAILLALRRE